jgi:hypothetical protein
MVEGGCVAVSPTFVGAGAPRLDQGKPADLLLFALKIGRCEQIGAKSRAL